MNVQSIPQQFRSLLIVTAVCVTLLIAAVSVTGVGAGTYEAASPDGGSLYLAGPVNDDGGGG